MPKTPDGPTPVVLGLEWRVWAQRTSFYLATRSTLKELKISLHGPERPGYDDYWKAGYDTGYVREHGKEGVLRYASPDMQDDSQPLVFPGQSIGAAVRHAVRMRWTGDLFQRGAPSGTPPKRLKEYSEAWLLPAPGIFHVSHLDFYVSQGQPWWPGGKNARDRNAMMGPLRNEADQYLTAVHFRGRVIGQFSEVPDRSDPIALPTRLRERVRGLSYHRHPNGFPQVDERWLPRSDSNENAG
ncbi:hypothetical protein [Kocuria palustris]|uniref:hypothetical protein n=1 Tax=Kocuria palustris TaxID=71999 RepID=UPI00204304C3|nr:hypothetical protein [Kocuria palustris]MCM3331396.1 hypothetical protein [Kocuria palustris]